MQLSRGLARSHKATVRLAIASLPEFTEALRVDDEGIHITNHTKLDSLAAGIVREAASAPYDLRIRPPTNPDLTNNSRTDDTRHTNDGRSLGSRLAYV